MKNIDAAINDYSEVAVKQKIASGDVAYDKRLLEVAMYSFGEMCEFAVKVMGYPLDLFLGMFAKSRIAKDMSAGYIWILGRKQGTEIAYAVEEDLRGCIIFRGHSIPDFSMEHRLFKFGRAIAFYQWYSTIPWDKMFSKISLFEMLDVYQCMSDGSYEKYCAMIDSLVEKREVEHSSPYITWQTSAEYDNEMNRLLGV